MHDFLSLCNAQGLRMKQDSSLNSSFNSVKTQSEDEDDVPLVRTFHLLLILILSLDLTG